MTLDRSLTALCFWTGALLPFAYLPLFLLGVDTLSRFAALLALVVINVIAMVVGHEYPGDRTPA